MSDSTVRKRLHFPEVAPNEASESENEAQKAEIPNTKEAEADEVKPANAKGGEECEEREEEMAGEEEEEALKKQKDDNDDDDQEDVTDTPSMQGRKKRSAMLAATSTTIDDGDDDDDDDDEQHHSNSETAVGATTAGDAQKEGGTTNNKEKEKEKEKASRYASTTKQQRRVPLVDPSLGKHVAAKTGHVSMSHDLDPRALLYAPQHGIRTLSHMLQRQVAPNTFSAQQQQGGELLPSSSSSSTLSNRSRILLLQDRFPCFSVFIPWQYIVSYRKHSTSNKSDNNNSKSKSEGKHDATPRNVIATNVASKSYSPDADFLDCCAAHFPELLQQHHLQFTETATSTTTTATSVPANSGAIVLCVLFPARRFHSSVGGVPQPASSNNSIGGSKEQERKQEEGGKAASSTSPSFSAGGVSPWLQLILQDVDDLKNEKDKDGKKEKDNDGTISDACFFSVELHRLTWCLQRPSLLPFTALLQKFEKEAAMLRCCCCGDTANNSSSDGLLPAATLLASAPNWVPYVSRRVAHECSKLALGRLELMCATPSSHYFNASLQHTGIAEAAVSTKAKQRQKRQQEEEEEGSISKYSLSSSLFVTLELTSLKRLHTLFDTEKYPIPTPLWGLPLFLVRMQQQQQRSQLSQDEKQEEEEEAETTHTPSADRKRSRVKVPPTATASSSQPHEVGGDDAKTAGDARKDSSYPSVFFVVSWLGLVFCPSQLCFLSPHWWAIDSGKRSLTTPCEKSLVLNNISLYRVSEF